MNFNSNKELVEYLKSIGVIKSKNVEEAFLHVDRKDFVDKRLAHLAYYEGALPIKNKSTISQPSVIARMLELLELKGDENVLEIGTGSGYSTALLAYILKRGRVTSIEIDKEVYEIAKKNLEKYGFKNIELVLGDGKKGYPKNAPYDRILVNAASKIEKAWLEQLKEDGFIVLPLIEDIQILSKVNKKGEIKRDWPVMFVELI